MIACVQTELVKMDPMPELPQIKINGESLTFKPFNFMDIRKYLPADPEDLKITSAAGEAKWYTEDADSFDISDKDLRDADYMKFVELIPQGLDNLGTIKFFYDGPALIEGKTVNMKKCALIGYEHGEKDAW